MTGVSSIGESDNTLSRAEIVDKAMKLADYTEGATPDEMAAVANGILRLRNEAHVRHILSGGRRKRTSGKNRER